MTQMFERYSRQILFPGIGEEGQKKIRRADLVVLGCGALGTVATEMLVRAGVGRVRIIDRDYVEMTNLQRQSLFTEQHARENLPKAIAARKVLRRINSEVEIDAVVEDLTWQNIQRLCEKAAVIVDGTDNFETRFLVNDFSVHSSIPWIYGACVGSYGIAFAFRPPETACLQCLFERPPEFETTQTCDTAGILSSVVHAVAAYQTTQALKILIESRPAEELFQVDVWEGPWRTVQAGAVRRKDCLCCERRDFRFLKGEETSRLTRLCGRGAVQVTPQQPMRPDFEKLHARLQKSATVDVNEYLMRVRVDGYEIALFLDGRSIIKGTENPSEARAVYAKYIGM